MEKINGGAMRILNFHTLTNTTEEAGRVAALVISERIQNGTYQKPEIEPLQKLHVHLLAEYPTDGNAGETLTGLFGEMKVLAPEILEVLEMYTLFGKPPTELYFADETYWSTVTWYGLCASIEEGSDCDLVSCATLPRISRSAAFVNCFVPTSRIFFTPRLMCA